MWVRLRVSCYCCPTSSNDFLLRTHRTRCFFFKSVLECALECWAHTPHISRRRVKDDVRGRKRCHAKIMDADLRNPRGPVDDTDVLQVRDNPPLCIFLNMFSVAVIPLLLIRRCNSNVVIPPLSFRPLSFRRCNSAAKKVKLN